MQGANSSSTMEVKSNHNLGDCVGKPSPIDAYGFVREDDFDYKSHEEFESEYLVVLSRRSMRWDKEMKKDKYQHDRKTKRFCRKGIPQQFRSRVWMDVSGARKKMESNPGLYFRLQTNPCKDSEVEANLQDAVATDLDRTFPDNVHFMNGRQEDQKNSLRNVLIAYGRHNPGVAYCQGMNYLTAMLLLVVKEEEKSFWLLSALVEDILPAYYSHEMLALRSDLAVLDDLVRLKFPVIDEKMKQLQATWMLLASKWFICVFADVISTETVLRIWDCLFFEGSKVLFRAALTIIHEKMTAILKCHSISDLVEIFRFSKSDAPTLDCHKFMQKCFSVPDPLKRKLIKDLRKKNKESIKLEDEALRKKIS